MRRLVWPGLAAGLALLALVPVLPGTAPSASSPIRVDQLGYRPRDRKLALVASAPATFAVRDAASQRVVFEGRAAPAANADPASGDHVAALDFTPVQTPGTYVVTAPGAETSPPFAIGEGVYAPVLRAVLRVFTYHRCGTAVQDGSPWARPACHLADAREWPSGPTRDVTGGWHDAGDYGKYVPGAALTLWHLAAMHDLAPSAEVREELRWELDWLLRMQRSDGAVHHKVAVAKWTADHAPHEDRDVRYLFGVSSTATADFAATAARMARLFRPSDAAYAGRLQTAAEAAWRWLELNPGIVPAGGFTNPPGVEGGDYDDPDDRDERFWAAVELWRTAGEARYRPPALAGLGRWTPFDYPASWSQVQNLAYLSLVEPGSPLDAGRRASLQAALTERSGWELDWIERGGYRVALTPQDYYWGSNGVVLGRAVQLLAAHRLTGRAAFRDAALDQVHYLFGRNALGKSFLTGFGADPVRRPTHQPSITHPRRLTLPGLLVGGPNARAEGVPATFPARAYRDHSELYGVNEPTIYWQAALAQVLVELTAAP